MRSGLFAIAFTAARSSRRYTVDALKCGFTLYFGYAFIPSLWNTVAFQAIVSVNVIGLFGSYGIPIFLRLRRGADFTPGPWNLGRWSRPVTFVAVVWIVCSSVLFLLPQQHPITHKTFNYAPVALAVVLLIATVWWFVTARRTYSGPISYGTPEELAAMEEDL